MLLLANSKEAVEYLTHGPFFTGFNGMFDWNFIFGILMIIGGGHPIVCLYCFPTLPSWNACISTNYWHRKTTQTYINAKII
nr:hypothetical protein [Mycoplasmopsis bovis]